jgi:hypothetical protein
VHAQKKTPTAVLPSLESEQAAIFWQGLESHSLVSVLQFSPENPGIHSHVYDFTAVLMHWPSAASALAVEHLPSFWHGELMHSSSSMSQYSPLNPVVQVHKTKPGRR